MDPSASPKLPRGWKKIALSAYEAAIAKVHVGRFSVHEDGTKSKGSVMVARLVSQGNVADYTRQHCVDGLDVSVIVATKGRRHEVNKLLECLERQTRCPSRVFVVGTQPDDIDSEALQRFRGFETYAWIADRPGLSLQRNEGLTHARDQGGLSRQSLIIFFDDDFRPAVDWIAKCERLFLQEGDVLAMTGHVLADGIRRPALTEAQAKDFLEARLPPRPHWSGGGRRGVNSVYGCNMAFLGSVFLSCAFDESLPLYGWQEDRDITGQVRKLGKAVLNPLCRGVHLGAGSGRTSDLRFGYSQIANVVYLLKKGTMDTRTTLQFLARALGGNIINLLRGRQQPAYALRLRGNLLALRHLMAGNCHPSRILELP